MCKSFDNLSFLLKTAICKVKKKSLLASPFNFGDKRNATGIAPSPPCYCKPIIQLVVEAIPKISQYFSLNTRFFYETSRVQKSTKIASQFLPFLDNKYITFRVVKSLFLIRIQYNIVQNFQLKIPATVQKFRKKSKNFL